MAKNHKIKVLLSKIGLDGHDRGIYLVAMALRDAGMEVIYLGRHRTLEQIAQGAIQEDVDVVGVSSNCQAHRRLMPQLIQLLRERTDKMPLVLLGGFIQPQDHETMKKAGVDGILGTGSKLDDIAEFIRDHVKRQ